MILQIETMGTRYQISRRRLWDRPFHIGNREFQTTPQQLTTGVFQATIWTALALLTVASIGCGPSEAHGTVSGKVTFRGQPVPEGLISFNNKEKGIHAVSKLNPDGSFRVDTVGGIDLPPGTYQVAVMPPRVEFPIDPTKPPPLPKDVATIPMKYRDPQTSKLELNVNEGENTLNIDMQP